MILLSALVFFAQTLVPVAPAPVAQSPTAVAERFVTVGARITRVSLFSTRVAVVSIREGEQQVFFRRMRLPEEQYQGFLVAINDSVASYDRDTLRTLRDQQGLERPDLVGKLLIHRCDEVPVPLEATYFLLTTQDLITARLVATFDDLEAVVSAVGPYHYELQQWQPAEGDEVELLNGRRAVVARVDLDQVTGAPSSVLLEHLASPMIEEVAISDLTQVVLRVLPEPPQ